MLGFFFLGDLTTDSAGGVLGDDDWRGAAEAGRDSFFFFFLRGSSTTTSMSMSLQVRTLRNSAEKGRDEYDDDDEQVAVVEEEVVAMETEELAADSKDELVDVEAAVGGGELDASGSGCTATACLAVWWRLRVGEPPPHKDKESSPAVEGGEEQG
jgi:hypothetical protein